MSDKLRATHTRVDDASECATCADGLAGCNCGPFSYCAHCDENWPCETVRALDALAAARAQVEQARRTSTYWKDELAAANRECEALSVRASKAEADLAAVRKVEEWEGLRGTRIKWVEAPREPQSEWRAWSWGLRATANPRIVATGDSIIALGRALAAQEGANG